MGGYAKLGFYQAQFDTYQQAKASGKIYFVRLDYAEPHKGLTQSAVYDAEEIIAEVKKCFGLEEQRLKFVLLDENDNLVDAM